MLSKYKRIILIVMLIRKTEHDSKWPYIPDYPYRILVIGGSGYRKTNAILNLINNQLDIDRIYLSAKDPYEKNINFSLAKEK